jgi:integrase
MYYFNNFRKRRVAEKTYQNDLNRYKKHLLPFFKEQSIRTITSKQCQDLLDQLDAKGINKTATEIFSIMSIIFKAAINHNIIIKNPLNLVYHEKDEYTHGKALSKEEEIKLLTETQNTEYQLMFAIALYTGMRPNEFETARREGDFIVCRNSKRKNRKIEYKKIPITPMLQPYIKNIQTFNFLTPYTLRVKFNNILPNHKLYDLRTTFYTRCTECNISDTAKKLFVGHSLGPLGNAYTDISDDYLLNEGKKLNY